MKTRFYLSLSAFLLFGVFIIAAPVIHHSSVAWAGPKYERPQDAETEGDPDAFDMKPGVVRDNSPQLATCPGDTHRETNWTRITRAVLVFLRVLASTYKWIP